MGAQFDAGELITQREKVSSEITRQLVKRAGEFFIKLPDVSITHLEFSDDYMKAVEQKQAAQLINEGMTAGSEFLEFRKIEAAKVIARTMSRSRNVSYLPGGGNVLLNLPNQ